MIPVLEATLRQIVRCVAVACVCATGHGVLQADEASPKDRGTLTLVSIHEDLLPGIRAVLPEFERLTGWRVRAQAVPYSAHDMWIRTQMISGAPPEVLLVESTLLPWRYGQSGLLVKMDAPMAEANRFASQAPGAWIDSFHPELIQQSRDATGALWCVPYTQYGVGFFYNKAVYDELGLAPPATWEQLIGNFRTVREHGMTAMAVAVKPNDGQTVWIGDMLLELLLRPVVPKVNLIAPKDWHYDPLDPSSTSGEVITLEERLVAFDRGLIDPAVAPAFRETARLMKEIAAEFRPDFLSLDGEEVPRIFARGQSVHFLNGTWFLNPLTAVQASIADVAPDRVFPWGVFPFPDLTSETTKLPRLGGINQNSGLRACFIVPRRAGDPVRERAACDLVRFLTAAGFASESFDRNSVHDLPAMRGVPPKPGTDPLVPKVRYAFLEVARLRGYDSRGEGEFWNLWQSLLSGRLDEDAFVKQLSISHRAALHRLAQEARLDRAFLDAQMGKGYEP